MKLKIFIVALGFMAIFAGCNDPVEQDRKDTVEAEKVIEHLKAVIKNTPQLRFQSKDGKGIDPIAGRGGFDFSNPGSGYSFTDESGSVYVSNEEGQYIYASSTAFGQPSPNTGSIRAGDYTYTMNATFCFSLGGFELFDDFGGGLAIAYGLDADFNINTHTGEIEIDADDDLSWLRAIVMHVVFDESPSGSYQVIDLEGNFDEGNLDFNKIAYSLIFDFQRGLMFFSYDGLMQVRIGDISFNGRYLEINFNFEDLFGGDDFEEFFRIVAGSGTIGC